MHTKLRPKKGEKLLTLESPTILIADDNESMRILLRTAITQWGYQVVDVQDGEEAWEVLQKPNAPQLLILDWVMPKLDGLALCERIRKELPTRPYIIFLTQVSGVKNIIRGLEAGADEFLLKPVNFEELRTRVFAGERIIKCLNTIDAQKKQMQLYELYIKILEQLILLK